MKVTSYLSEKVRDLFIILPADATPESLSTEVKVRLGDLTFFKEFDLSTEQPRLGIDTEVAVGEILAKGYYLVRTKMKFTVTEVATASNEPMPARKVKSQMSRTLTMITGAGTSIAFGLPSTCEFTELIARSLRENLGRVGNTYNQRRALALYERINSSLESYLRNARDVNFEDIYQSIHDVSTLQFDPHFPMGYNEFRPRVGSTHTLSDQFSSFCCPDGMILQDDYLDSLLDTFLEALDRANRTDLLSAALDYIRSKFTVWSFTLNYDNLIGDALDGFTSGFIPGPTPRVFRPAILFSAIEECDPIHSHLHGSLKLGFPLGEPLDMFELHEYETPEGGVRHSKSRPRGRTAQNGETLPPSPIITGLNKTEFVFKQPFFTNFLAFFRSLNLCNDVLIAGYGFADRHVNTGIEQFRRYRPECRTYIVDWDNYGHPTTYIERLTPDAWRAILPGDPFRSVEVPESPGWWRLPGISSGGFNTGTIFLWLRGFDTFCEAVVNNGFPE